MGQVRRRVKGEGKERQDVDSDARERVLRVSVMRRGFLATRSTGYERDRQVDLRRDHVGPSLTRAAGRLVSLAEGSYAEPCW